MYPELHPPLSNTSRRLSRSSFIPMLLVRYPADTFDRLFCGFWTVIQSINSRLSLRTIEEAIDNGHDTLRQEEGGGGARSNYVIPGNKFSGLGEMKYGANGCNCCNTQQNPGLGAIFSETISAQKTTNALSFCPCKEELVDTLFFCFHSNQSSINQMPPSANSCTFAVGDKISM